MDGIISKMKSTAWYVLISRYTLVFSMLILLAACSSTKPPAEKLTRTEAAISQAEQAGAEEYAPLEVREARKKLEKARELSEDEKYEEARRLAEQAEVDAELAEVKTLSEKAQNTVKQLRESIRLLQEEIQRNQ